MDRDIMVKGIQQLGRNGVLSGASTHQFPAPLADP